MRGLHRTLAVTGPAAVTRRDLLAGVIAVLATALIIWLSYLFFSRLWSRLPPWAAVPLSIVIAATAIGGPIWTLLRWSEQRLQRSKKDTDGPEHGPPKR